MKIVEIHDAQANLLQLVERAVAGEDIVIGRNGRAVVRITRVEASLPVRFGLLEGRLRVAPDFDSRLPASVEATFTDN